MVQKRNWKKEAEGVVWQLAGKQSIWTSGLVVNPLVPSKNRSMIIKLSVNQPYHLFIHHWTPDKRNKKLRYHRVTARCILSVVILPITTQQCRNYLYDKSWRNWWYEVGGLVWRQCVINKSTTVELCISPVYLRLAVVKFFLKSTM